MPQPIQPSRPELPYKRPTCAECGTLMWLVAITPKQTGEENQHFECQVCKRTEDVTAKFN